MNAINFVIHPYSEGYTKPRFAIHANNSKYTTFTYSKNRRNTAYIYELSEIARLKGDLI